MKELDTKKIACYRSQLEQMIKKEVGRVKTGKKKHYTSVPKRHRLKEGKKIF